MKKNDEDIEIIVSEEDEFERDKESSKDYYFTLGFIIGVIFMVLFFVGIVI